MHKAVGRKKEGDRPTESDCYGQSTGCGFLLTACCLLPSIFSVSLCLCGDKLVLEACKS
jgi:hypothetical protein